MKLFFSVAMAMVLLVSTACGKRDLGYDPEADPALALVAAQKEAAASGKSVLVIAGGDWCRWCHVLDRFIERNDDVETALDEAFVTLKVYVGEEGMNEAFFADLPQAQGYPHFWVLANDGTAQSFGTGDLESGEDDYDKELFLRFIRDASAASPSAAGE